MDRLSLTAEERTILGKKVKKMRKDGVIPGHVFGKKVETEHVSVKSKDFWPVFNQAGETGLIDLKIGDEKVRPVMIRGIQRDPVKEEVLHIDFYQVNLSEKVKVPVPVVMVGSEEIEKVKIGEAVVLQPLTEIEVEALPTDLIDSFEVNISSLKNIDDAITVGQLTYDRSKITVVAEPGEIVVKLAPALTEEMKKLMEEQAAEQAAAAEAAAEEGGEAPVEEEATEGEEGVAGQEKAEGGGEEAKIEASGDKGEKTEEIKE